MRRQHQAQPHHHIYEFLDYRSPPTSSSATASRYFILLSDSYDFSRNEPVGGLTSGLQVNEEHQREPSTGRVVVLAIGEWSIRSLLHKRLCNKKIFLAFGVCILPLYRVYRSTQINVDQENQVVVNEDMKMAVSQELLVKIEEKTLTSVSIHTIHTPLTVLRVEARKLLDREEGAEYMENIFPLYSLFGYITLHMLMYAADIYFWRRYRVNYAFIFGFKKGTEHSYCEVFLLSTGLAVLSLGGFLANLHLDLISRRSCLLCGRMHLQIAYLVLPRQFCDEKDVKYICNGLKYLSTIVAVIIRTVYEMQKGKTSWMVVALISPAVATTMNTYRDIVIDRGLLRKTSKNKHLRDRLLVSHNTVYFPAMVRLENEHLNNVGQYCAFKSVPLPFGYCDVDADKDD
ncbi:phosphate transporter PHO1 10-like [Pyrus ussuriensis x Pyrus communis]|uniref:Phosphate transporter PHO1 10-like n=1 Tax=Pyrus ussuriensis x Pyrus communis TaxID=2448454 RepID=A0A5N5HMN2_9ROSA|nr:phosphate transporter PHO1 10-like [Pyrus ussuriensis x Pyrus communis]